MLTLFFLTIIFIFYTFIGYPIIIYLLSKSRRLGEDFNAFDSDKHFDLTILMVVCNEEEKIIKKIDNLLKLTYFNKLPEIIIVDDSSTDSTIKKINSLNNDRINVIKIQQRAGKANGINIAMEKIHTPLVLMVDVRQEINIDAAEKLSRWFEIDQSIGAVSGELCFKSDNENDFSKGMDGYWRYEKFIRKSEARFSSVPGVTGAIYMLRRNAFKIMPEDTILDDVLIPMVAINSGYRIGFDENTKAWDIPSNNHENERQRKIRTISGNFQLLFRNPKWLIPAKHAIWWQYLSHKIMRLFVPLCALFNLLIAMYLASNNHQWALVYVILFIFSILLYPLNKILPIIEKNKFIRLWVSFLALNWFSVLGLYDYLFSSRDQSWKK